MSEESAATQETTTEATETQEFSAEEIVGSILPGFGSGSGGESANDGAEEAEASGQQAEEESGDTTPKNPEEAIRNDAIFSEQALSSKGGILHARQALLEARKHQRAVADQHADTHRKLSSREGRLREDRQEYNRRLAAFEAVEKGRAADLELLFNGSGDEPLHALGRLARKSGSEAYEALTSAMLGQKKTDKNAKPDPLLEELRNELKGLKEGLQTKQTREQQQAQEAKRNQWLQDVNQVASSNLDKLPGIKHSIEAFQNGPEILNWIHQEHLADVESGGEIRSISQLILDAEGELVKLVPPEKRQAAKKPGAAGRPFGAAPSATRAATNGQRKSVFEMSDEERLEALAGEDGILASLGLGR